MKVRLGRLLRQRLDAQKIAQVKNPKKRKGNGAAHGRPSATGLERVIEKRAACNIKRYPVKWKQLPDEEALLLPRIQEDTIS